MADEKKPDISREFTCFVSNGFQNTQGSLRLEPDVLQIVNFHGIVLEQIPYSSIVSVNNEEPPTEHSLIIHLHSYAIYASYLLRKEKLVKFFVERNLFKDDFHVPVESLGFVGSDRLAEIMLASSTPELCNEPPDVEKVLHNLSLHFTPQEDKGYTVSSVPKKSAGSKKGKKKNSQSTWPLHHQREVQNPPSDAQHTTSGGINKKEPVQFHVTPTPSSNISSVPAPDTQPATTDSAYASTDKSSLVLELQILFPNKTETDLRQALMDSDYNTDVAVSNIFAADSLANARSANGQNC